MGFLFISFLPLLKLQPSFTRANDARDAYEKEPQPEPECPQIRNPLEVENHQNGGPGHKDYPDDAQS